MAITALDAAKWFMSQNYDTPQNTYDGNMKLQKLLYFAQLIHMAKYGEVLFKDPIYAFENGPVVENVRQDYKRCYYQLKRDVGELDPSIFTRQELDTLEKTGAIFGSSSAKELSKLNHLHLSWKNALVRSTRPGGYHVTEDAKITINSIAAHDLDGIHELLKAAELTEQLNLSHETINGVTFFYDPAELTLTDELIQQLEFFKGTEPAYSLGLDKHGLVVY
ncbi:hypothetical protein CEB3_c34850 [Peptococcaceae bacterium CEB3]|nr:hypothetical protein CEB3_c34850 [Peptococcaceae bacterium CEB3]